MKVEPEHSSTQSFELPLPDSGQAGTGADSEQLGARPEGETASSVAIEQPSAASGHLPVLPPMPADPAATAIDPAGTIPTSTLPSAIVSGSPQIADDLDLIEKEWVDKAKEIVNHTRQDPYAQNKEINKVKADYLKKRYNKDIKLSDE